MSHNREEKDGYIPTWDGTPEKWDTYVIEVGVHLKTEPSWKISQKIAKLISRLTSKAWELVEQTEESSLDALITKELYLGFLKKNLLASAVPELGRHFRKWYAFRRLKSESMKLYVMRHRKMFIDLEKAMSLNDAPVVVDFQVHPDAMVWPMVAAGMSNDDIKIARDLAPEWESGAREL
jgi:hypothetical protein